jgi:molybdenum cofactor guanylyltransferase
MGSIKLILGCILAGGQSSRFGSDKALAELGGQTLLVRAVDFVAGLCDAVVVVGRDRAPVLCLPDYPCAGLGPLGGLAAALNYAQEQGFADVLSVGVDSLDLPPDLLDRLAPAPAYLADQPVIGLWPASASAQIAAILRGDGRKSLYHFAEVLAARAVVLDKNPMNINSMDDLSAARGRLDFMDP